MYTLTGSCGRSSVSMVPRCLLTKPSYMPALQRLQYLPSRQLEQHKRCSLCENAASEQRDRSEAVACIAEPTHQVLSCGKDHQSSWQVLAGMWWCDPHAFQMQTHYVTPALVSGQQNLRPCLCLTCAPTQGPLLSPPPGPLLQTAEELPQALSALLKLAVLLRSATCCSTCVPSRQPTEPIESMDWCAHRHCLGPSPSTPGASPRVALAGGTQQRHQRAVALALEPFTRLRTARRRRQQQQRVGTQMGSGATQSC